MMKRISKVFLTAVFSSGLSMLCASEEMTATEQMFLKVQETSSRLGVTFDASEPRPGLRVFRGMYAALHERQAMDRELREIYARMQAEALLPSDEGGSELPVGDILKAFAEFVEKSIRGEAPPSKTVQVAMEALAQTHDVGDDEASDDGSGLFSEDEDAGGFPDDLNGSGHVSDAELEQQADELSTLKAEYESLSKELEGVDLTSVESKLRRFEQDLARETELQSTPFVASPKKQGEQRGQYQARIDREKTATRLMF